MPEPEGVPQAPVPEESGGKPLHPAGDEGARPQPDAASASLPPADTVVPPRVFAESGQAAPPPDELGNLQDALRVAAKMAHLGGQPRVVEMGRSGLLDVLSGGDADLASRLRLPGAADDEARLLRALRKRGFSILDF